MTESKILLLVGAACSLAGFMLLFRFGMPARVATGGVGYLVLEARDEEEARTDRIYRAWGNLGLFLNIAGALLQLVGTALG